jgi:hypothetical protein
MLQELMLRQLGITATSELILPTLPNSAIGRMNLFTAADVGKIEPTIPASMLVSDPFGEPQQANLYFDYDGQPNNFEGGVLVTDPNNPLGSEFYSQGHKPNELVVGSTTLYGTAEYNAIVQIAKNFSKGKNITSQFQGWYYEWGIHIMWKFVYLPSPSKWRP